LTLAPFARLMRRWSGLHPYNAIVTAEVVGELDPERLREEAHRALGELGYPGRLRFEAGGEDEPTSDAAFDACATRELNEPFGPDEVPFRIHVARAKGRTRVGITWDHWAAGGRSASWLALHGLSRALDAPIPNEPWPPQGRAGVPPARTTLHAMRGLVRDLLRMRHAFAPAAGDRDDLRVSAHTLALAPDVLARMNAAMRARGAAFQDLLLAALAEALAAATPERTKETRRRELALGIVVELGALSPNPFAFGNALGHFPVFASPDEAPVFDAMLASISEQTRARMSPDSYAQSLLELNVANLLWPLVKRSEKGRYFRRQWVLAGGISNIKMPSAFLAPPLGDRIASYRCYIPTGPLLPLVVLATRVRRAVVLTATFQTSAWRLEQREAILRILKERLESL
jgi:hypothetical protein